MTSTPSSPEPAKTKITVTPKTSRTKTCVGDLGVGQFFEHQGELHAVLPRQGGDSLVVQRVFPFSRQACYALEGSTEVIHVTSVNITYTI